VIDVWRPNPRAGRDIPCTLSFQFLVREGRLHVVQCMRSSDAWLGYPYDVFNASMLAGYVMLLLRKRKARRRDGLRLGTHTMHVGSSHVYETNYELVRQLLASSMDTVFDPKSFDPYEFYGPDDLIGHLWKLAAQDFRACTVRWLADDLELAI